MISQSRYQHVAGDVRDGIASGRYPPGARLPSEADLCRAHGVSRGTVVKAIEQLVAEGAVTRRQGLGSFVARPTLRRPAGGLASFSESVAAQGRRAFQHLLLIETAGGAEARAAGFAEPATRLVRLRLVDDAPCAIHTSLVPDAVLGRLPLAEQERLRHPEGSDFSLYGALAAAGHVVERASEHVSVRLAGPSEAQVLAGGDPLALMILVRRSHDARGRLIEVTEAAVHSDYYHLDTELIRGVGRPAAT